MKILCITSSYPRFAGDISGHFVEELNDLLRSEGHEVKTLAWNGQGVVKRKDTHFVHYAPGSFETLFFGSGAPENLEKSSRYLLIPLAVAAMWRAIVKEEKPDLVIGHWALPGGFLARQAGTFFGVPSLVIAHSGGLHLMRKLRKSSILRHILLDGEFTIPSSAFFNVVPDGKFLPIGFHTQKKEEHGQERSGVLVMSRLEKIKNIERVIRAWNAMETPPILHIAGNGSHKKTLQKLAKENRNIVFHGFVRGPDKEALLSKCKYYFLPSKIQRGRHEGFPIALLQAIDAGLIPLVARFPGVEDILTSEFIVDANASWNERFFKLQYEEVALGNIRNEVYKRRWSVIGPTWVAFIEKLSDRKS